MLPKPFSEFTEPVTMYPEPFVPVVVRFENLAVAGSAAVRVALRSTSS